MISTKKEKALMGCLIPQRNAADLRRSGRCKGAGLKIPWKLHWREKRRKTYRPPEQKRRKSGESEQGISKPDEKKKSMRTEGQYCIQPSVSKKSSAAKKKEKAQLSAQSAPERLHIRSARRKKVPSGWEGAVREIWRNFHWKNIRCQNISALLFFSATKTASRYTQRATTESFLVWLLFFRVWVIEARTSASSHVQLQTWNLCAKGSSSKQIASRIIFRSMSAKIC